MYIFIFSTTSEQFELTISLHLSVEIHVSKKCSSKKEESAKCTQNNRI
jgi:hypothetical protein